MAGGLPSPLRPLAILLWGLRGRKDSLGAACLPSESPSRWARPGNKSNARLAHATGAKTSLLAAVQPGDQSGKAEHREEWGSMVAPVRGWGRLDPVKPAGTVLWLGCRSPTWRPQGPVHQVHCLLTKPPAPF